jgi:voltage-gated potassium channel
MPGLRRRYLLGLLGRLAPFLLTFGSVYVGTSVLFFLLENGKVTLFNSFYWAIVTISTAGYGDIVPTNTLAKVDAMVTLFIQIFLLGFLITVIATTVTSEQQKRALGLLGTDFKGHIVVLGYSPVGKAAVRELLAQEQTVAVVAQAAEEVANIRAVAPEKVLYVTYGPAAERDILVRANVPAAHSVVICTSDDATNMIAALNVRALAPSVRIVVSVARPELRDTLRAAGVTYVASPSDMGGRLCAAAAFEPEVAHALEDLSSGDVRSDIQEYLLSEHAPLIGLGFDAAAVRVRQETGCILVGYARPSTNGEFETFVDPPPDAPLRSGDAVLLLGTIENTRRFRRWFGRDQGR